LVVLLIVSVQTGDAAQEATKRKARCLRVGDV